MWPYMTATLRLAVRSPVTWALCALGIFLGWFATTAAILALDEVGEQSMPLIFSTSHLVGVLLALWLLGRSLEEDRQSGFASAADATAPGVPGRLLGRWAGAVCAGTSLAVLVGLLISSSASLLNPNPLLLLSTSIIVISITAAWAMLLGVFLGGGGAGLGAFLLWIVGHLPWGQAPMLEGVGGRLAVAWLPGPCASDASLALLGYTSAAVAGILLMTLAVSRPADA